MYTSLSARLVDANLDPVAASCDLCRPKMSGKPQYSREVAGKARTGSNHCLCP